MKLSLAGLVLLSIGFVAAAPTALLEGRGKPPPPGPPSGSINSYANYCGNSISLSSLSCCTQKNSGNAKANGNKDNTDKKDKDNKDTSSMPQPAQVVHQGNAYDMQCSAINNQNSDPNAVVNVCSVTVACCYGAYCTAIAN